MTDPVLLLAVNRIPCLRWDEKLRVLDAVRTLDGFLRLRPVDAALLAGRRLRNLVWRPGDLAAEAEKHHRAAESRKIRILPWTEPGYPPQLREIYDPPFLLFARGALPDWSRPALAVVGTRMPTGAGRRAAYELAFQAAEAGIPVVSGLARGIDGEAHRGCLDAGGLTVAVLGNGADGIYPVSHRGLAESILEAGGLALTEYAPGEGVRRHHFPARNRIISGLCRGVVIVEAPLKSGALLTADYALEQGRDLFVHGGCLEGENGAGLRRLAEDGAPAIFSLDAILEEWSPGTRRPGDSRVPAGPERRGPGDSGAPGRSLALFLQEELEGNTPRPRGHYFRRLGNG